MTGWLAHTLRYLKPLMPPISCPLQIASNKRLQNPGQELNIGRSGQGMRRRGSKRSVTPDHMSHNAVRVASLTAPLPSDCSNFQRTLRVYHNFHLSPRHRWECLFIKERVELVGADVRSSRLARSGLRGWSAGLPSMVSPGHSRLRDCLAVRTALMCRQREHERASPIPARTTRMQ
jgi:hypothetical protein